MGSLQRINPLIVDNIYNSIMAVHDSIMNSVYIYMYMDIPNYGHP